MDYFYAKPVAAGCVDDLAEAQKNPARSPRLTPSSKIVIIGSGCFGVSTALHLLRRGYKDVTILDRSPILPAPDAASTDINKSEQTSSQLAEIRLILLRSCALRIS